MSFFESCMTALINVCAHFRRVFNASYASEISRTEHFRGGIWVSKKLWADIPVEKHMC